MFKNVFAFRIEKEFLTDDFINKVSDNKVPENLAPGQQEITGWTEFFDEGDELVYSVAGMSFLKLRTLKKKVPASAVKEGVRKHMAEVFKKTGEKANKKDAKEFVVSQLLKNAITEFSDLRLYIDNDNKLLIVEASSPKKADLVLDCLANIIGERPFKDLKLEIDPEETFMGIVRNSLINEKNLKNALVFGEKLKMVSNSSDNKASVNITKEEIITDKVKDYLLEDKIVKEVELVFQSRVSFTISENLILRSINMSDSLKNEIVESLGEDDNKISEFNATAFIFKNEIVDILDMIKNVIKE